ncbi:hypothetical protein [Clostridium sp. JS66]|uniref:hypothetical protein n=1 Tax=Clostridium sp. JS66 TaxID=3064705 RepID=UPI00298D8826|nr:hypothetical protein [Clostridium sp. JS66]WPC41216.1 hypothetical protein Q6H37_25505 [Clostridium sp. JS66]
MKSKKIIASLMALSIIGSSSVVLGGTAKAAGVNGTSNAVLSEKKLQQSNGYDLKVRGFNLQMTSSGIFTWERFYKEVAYNNYYVLPEDTSSGVAILQSGTTYGRTNSVNISNIKPGTYKFVVHGLDSNNNVVGIQYIRFVYDGNTYSTIGMNLTFDSSGIVSWNRVNNADSYECYLHTGNKFSDRISICNNAPWNTQFDVKDLNGEKMKPGKYYVTIDACDHNFSILQSQTLQFYYDGNTYTRLQ